MLLFIFKWHCGDLWWTEWHWDSVCGGQSGTGTVVDSGTGTVLVVGRVALGQCLRRLLQFSSFSIILPTLHNHLSTCCSYQRDKELKLGTLKKQCLFGNGGALDRQST
jgi:hypothetical protein